MKTIFKYILLVAAVGSLVSCADFLDDQPENSNPIKGTDYTKADNIFLSISATYAKMRADGLTGQPYIAMCEVIADNADKGSTTDDLGETKDIEQFTYTQTNVLLNSAWVDLYNVVSAANFALEEMPKYEEALPADSGKLYARQCGGEAKFMRAFAYFQLIRLFGNIYIADRTYTAAEINSLPQVSRTKVYEFIIKDLTEAIDVLPEKFTGEYELPGRINKYSALALLSKVYLYKAGNTDTQAADDYTNAAKCTDKVIASGFYSLLGDYRTVFRPAGENSTESLFEIQSSTMGKYQNYQKSYTDYGYLQGPRDNAPSNMQGWGLCTPSYQGTGNLLDFFAARGDAARKEVVFMQRGTTYEGDQILAKCPNEYYNGKVFTPSGKNTWGINGYSKDYNIRMLRYADILLIHAEALVRGASTTDLTSGMTADGAVNLVRDRAGLSTPGGYTLDQILDERRAELCMEEDRFFDLVRTGKASQVLGAKGFTVGKNEIFPIPAIQRNINQGLQQNPGYAE